MNDVSSVTVTAQDVMRFFGELRGEIAEIANQLESMGAEAGRAGEAARVHLIQARAEVDDSRLNLVVVGGEGQGKSTLINAILGRQLTPVSEVEPGTVAPVYIQHGNSDRPTFEVQIAGEIKPRSLPSQDAFDRLLLQEYNKRNEKQVIEGTIKIAHELLAHGLKIVDMPGTEGASPDVDMVAQNFIRESAHTTVGVMRRSGGFGSLSRISRLMPPNRNPEAIIFNSDDENWKRRSESDQRQFVVTQRGRVISKLQEGSPDLAIPEESVFVLHLPTLHALQLGRVEEIEFESAVHEAEMVRFDEFIWTYMRTNGVNEVIPKAAQSVEEAIRELGAWLSWRERALEAIKEGGDEYERLQSNLAEGLRSARAFWASKARPETVNRFAAETWPAVKEALIAHREALQDIVHELRQQLEGVEGRLSKTEAVVLRGELDTRLLERQEQLNVVQKKALNSIADQFINHANEALVILYDHAPILRETVGRMLITPEEVVRIKLGSSDPGALDQVGQIVAVGGSGLGLAAICGAIPGVSGIFAGGGNLALLLPFMNPVAGLFVGAAAGAAIGYGVYTFLRDPRRSGLQRVLDTLQKDIAKIDATEQGEARRRWMASIDAIVPAIGAALDKRIIDVEAVFTNPTGSENRLRDEQREVSSLLAELNSMEAALTRIAERVQR